MLTEVRAFSKVNLHLEVLGRRADGYHNIFSLMASTSLSDSIRLDDLQVFGDESPFEITINARRGSFRHIIERIPVEKNLIARAVRGYFDGTGKACKISVSIEKNIPDGAGLGGGSSDAAAILRMLNEQCGLYDLDSLLSAGAKIGADVPYCICGGFAICEGVGEIIRRIDSDWRARVLLVNDGIHVDTGGAYKALGRTGDFVIDSEALSEKRALFIQGLLRNDFGSFKSILRNDFEEAVFGQHPEIALIKKDVMSFDPDYAAMTGSGSTVLGVFSDFEKASRAERDLKGKYRNVILAELV